MKPPASSPFGVLANKDFALLWLGLLISSVGDWVNYVAMVALVYQQTHSAPALVILRLFHIVPILLIAPVAGVFVDRWSRKRTMVIAAFIASVSAGILVWFHAVPLVFLSYGAITIALTFFNPARSAAIPTIVSDDQLVPANSLSQITATASIVVGGLVGGALVAGFGVNVAFFINGLSFLVVAAAVWMIRIPDTREFGDVRSVEREMMEGIRHLWDVPLVGTVVLAGGVFVFAPASVLTLGIQFVQTVLHGTPAEYGQILAGLGVGSALGAALMIGFRNRVRADLTFALSGIVLGAGVLGLGLSRTLLPAVLTYGVSGFGSMVNTVSGVTLLQRLVPDRIRGRIFSVSFTIDHLGAFVSTLGIGLGAGFLDAGGLITVSGAVAAVAGLVALSAVLVRKPTS